jgi:hypothetical protein
MIRRHVRMSFARAHGLALMIAVAAGLGALAGPASAAYTGHRLYAVSTTSTTGRLVPFDIDASGQLHERSDQAVTVPGSVTGLTVDRRARSVFVSSRDVYDDDDSRVPGVIEVFTIGADGALTLAQTVQGGTFTIAMAPDGSLFSQLLTGEFDSYPVLADGTLGAVRTQFPFTQPANALAIAPDSKTLYMAGQNDLSFQWAIADNASISFLTQGIFGPPSGPCYPVFIGLAVGTSNVDIQCYFGSGWSFTPGADGGLSPNGGAFTGSGAQYGNVEDVRGRAFYSGVGNSSVAQFKRQANGTLAPFLTATVTGPSQTRALAEDPDGTALTAATTSNGFQTYLIGADGSLSGAPIASTATAMSTPSYLAYSPQQAPVAALSSTQAANGVTSFDASASHALGGRTIARYDWSFGDGSSLADAGPAPGHTYPQPGDYTATVAVTDSAGCSLAGTFNGSLSICAGGTGARASEAVHVTAPGEPEAPAVVEAGSSQQGSPNRVDAPRPTAATATPDRSGKQLLLTWATPADAPDPAAARYLVAWSTLHSAHGPGDPNMHHLRVTGKTHVRLRTPPRSTVHLAVYAYGADGTLTRATKTTVRLPS